ncbi:MAG: DUF86 domain-containing protein [Deltaproteobacteria bacterium]|nr:DUF86 domain-containing protein [Deltaproteobacteria bacterium]
MREVLFQKIQRFMEEIKYLEDNKDRFLKEVNKSVDIKKMAERSIFLCAEMALDICDILIVEKGFPKPATYRDAIYKLGDFNIIPKDFAYNFVYIAGLRNFLAHEYLKDTTQTLKEFLNKGILDLKEFINFVKQ